MRKTIGLSVSIALVCVFALGSGHAGPAFGTPVKMPGSTNYIEPGIDVGPDGTIYINSPIGLPEHSKMWRSKNNGASFDNLPFAVPFSRFPGGGDSDVVVTPSGRVYFLDLWAGSNSLARADDGATWNIGTPFTTLPLSDRQWITVGGPGALPGEDTVFVVYSTFEANVFVARSDTSGVLWATQTPILSSSGFTGPIVADQSGFVAFDAVDGGFITLEYSTQNGDFNTYHKVDIADGGFDRSIPSLAMANGSLYATWIDSNTFQVMEAHASVTDPETWSTPVQISAGGSNIYSWVDSRDGKVAIAWYGTDTGSGQPNQNAGPWFLKYSESVDSGATFTAAINAVPNAVKSSIVCTDGVGCPNLGHDGRELGDFLQLAVDLSGNSLITYVDANAGNVVKVVKQTP